MGADGPVTCQVCGKVMGAVTYQHLRSQHCKDYDGPAGATYSNVGDLLRNQR